MPKERIGSSERISRKIIMKPPEPVRYWAFWKIQRYKFHIDCILIIALIFFTLFGIFRDSEKVTSESAISRGRRVNGHYGYIHWFLSSRSWMFSILNWTRQHFDYSSRAEISNFFETDVNSSFFRV
jgi:hypothetical protein